MISAFIKLRLIISIIVSIQIHFFEIWIFIWIVTIIEFGKMWCFFEFKNVIINSEFAYDKLPFDKSNL